MQFTVVGVGALGTILAATLSRAGYKVRVVARGDRAAQIEQTGLTVNGLMDLQVPCEVITRPAEIEQADVIIFAVKSYDNMQAIQSLQHLSPRAVFSVANGVMKNDELRSAFGQETVLGCMADFSGELEASGSVKFTRNVGLFIGHAEAGISPIALELEACLKAAGLAAQAVSSINTVEWSKFVGWVGLASVAVISRLETPRFLADPDLAEVMVQVVRETARLAEHYEVELVDQSPIPVATIAYGSKSEAAAAVAHMARQFNAQAPGHLMSALQDLNRGRRLEYEATLGYALKALRRLQLDSPKLHTCYLLLAGLSRTHSSNRGLSGEV